MLDSVNTSSALRELFINISLKLTKYLILSFILVLCSTRTFYVGIVVFLHDNTPSFIVVNRYSWFSPWIHFFWYTFIRFSKLVVMNGCFHNLIHLPMSGTSYSGINAIEKATPSILNNILIHAIFASTKDNRWYTLYIAYLFISQIPRTFEDECQNYIKFMQLYCLHLSILFRTDVF